MTDRIEKNRTNPAQRNAKGFTLIELLVVIIIIAILAAVTVTIQRTAVESALHARTEATVRKIDTALIAAYEKYQYRKVDVEKFITKDDPTTASIDEEWAFCQNWINTVNANYNLNIYYDDSDATDAKGKARHLLRTLMLRELLMFDFPTCEQEVIINSVYGQPTTALHSLYQQELAKAGSLSNADLLYLIVTNIDPATRGVFLERETVDTNGNGIPEFVDGWGTPIGFLRWAPALSESNRQTTYASDGTFEGPLLQRYYALQRENAVGNLAEEGVDYDLYANFDTYYPGLRETGADPLDPLALMDGWFLVPLIFSIGPDKEAGLAPPTDFIDSTNSGRNTPGVCVDPFQPAFVIDSGDGNYIGLGADDGTGASADNITNHNLE